MRKTTVGQNVEMLVGALAIRVGGIWFFYEMLKTIAQSNANQLVKAVFMAIIAVVLFYLAFAPFLAKVFYSFCNKKEKQILRKNTVYKISRGWSIPSRVWNLATAIKNDRW